MKAIIFAWAVVLVGLLLQTQAPNRPFPNHEEPPADWFCSRQNLNETVPRDHVCDCQRECKKDGNGTAFVAEDPLCKVYCHKEHCTCEVKPCDSQ